jgi:hypothetical protein
MKVVERMTEMQLTALVDTVINPAGKGLTADQIDENLYSFCLNCPDPVGAMNCVLEAKWDDSAESITRRALLLSARPVMTLSEDELALDHPLRTWRLRALM